MESIGKGIREIIRKKKLSFYRVSKNLGIAQESLYRSLLDTGNPKWKRIKEILDYLDYEVVLRPKRKEVKPEKQKPSRSRR